MGADRWPMQLGTLSGKPVTCAAGLKTPDILRRDGQYDLLAGYGWRFTQIMMTALTAGGVVHRVFGHEPPFDTVFNSRDVSKYHDVKAGNAARCIRFDEVPRAHGRFKSASKTHPCLALSEAILP
jgi:glutamate-1-semialdehyde 2,1-aminomutase